MSIGPTHISGAALTRALEAYEAARDAYDANPNAAALLAIDVAAFTYKAVVASCINRNQDGAA